jgi:hypothetical protein
MRKWTIVAAACASVAGCGPVAGDQKSGNIAAAPAAGSSQALPSGNGAPAASERRLAVDGEGIRLAAAGADARLLAFGLPETEVLPAIEAIRGEAQRSTNSECGAGPMDIVLWGDGLMVLIQEGRFVGWSLDSRGEGTYATASGIGPGATRARLEAAYEAQVEQSTLGTEFSGGGLGGILEGDGPEARIGTMWAGTTCVFR